MKVDIANHILNSAFSIVPPLLQDALRGVDVIHEGRLTLIAFTKQKALENLLSLPDPVLPDGSLDFMVNYSQLGRVLTIHVSPRSFNTPPSRVIRDRAKAIVHEAIQLYLFGEFQDKEAA